MGLPEERMVLPRLKALARETGIPLVATNDCHYLYREDAAAQEVLMCIQTGKTLQDETRMRMETEELYGQERGGNALALCRLSAGRASGR